MIKEWAIQIRVRYADVDRMSVAYNSRYLEWFEMGRTELLRAMGKSYKELEEAGILLPVYEAYCKYLKPAFYDELIKVNTQVRKFTPTRIEFFYEVFGSDGRKIAEGFTVHPFVDTAWKPKKLDATELAFFE